jgi:predicted nuclease of predicted toxin-antitoxin system
LRLLFDENLSHRLVERLADVFPGSVHVRDIGMKSSADRAVLAYAAAIGLVLVTKDGDFDELALLSAGAVRVLRLDVGNCTTDEVERVLRSVAPSLTEMLAANRFVAIVRG